MTMKTANTVELVIKPAVSLSRLFLQNFTRIKSRCTAVVHSVHGCAPQAWAGAAQRITIYPNISESCGDDRPLRDAALNELFCAMSVVPQLRVVFPLPVLNCSGAARSKGIRSEI